MIAHKNYFAPAGTIEKTGDPSWTWNGRQWLHNGRPEKLPLNVPLRGKPGGQLAGWSYDWRAGAWMEPTTAAHPQPMPHPAPIHAAPMHAAPMHPPAPHPAPSTTQGAHHHPDHEHKEKTMQNPKSMLDHIKDHPVAPVAGILLMVMADLADEPAPPDLTGMSSDQQGMAQMIYNQNLTRFQRRMQKIEKWGAVLLGYSATTTAIESSSQAHHAHAQHDPSKRAA